MKDVLLESLELCWKSTKLPVCTVPYVGKRYNSDTGRILIVSEALFISKNSELSTVDTPFDYYENAERFYRGEEKDLAALADDPKKENEISVANIAENLRSYLESDYFRSVSYDDCPKKGEDKEENFLTKLAYTLSKARASIDDIAIYRFFLRPCVVDGKKTDNYFNEMDKNIGIDMLVNVINSLCPKKIFFTSQNLANLVSSFFENRRENERMDEFFKARGILNDLDSTWDSDKKRIEAFFSKKFEDKVNESDRSESLTGQKRMRLLADALIEIENELRQKTVGMTEGAILKDKLNDLRAVADNIKALVSKHEENLKRCGSTKNKKRVLSLEEQEKRRERMKKAREKRWIKT
ncbi:hypothetical protein [Fibrobacter sp.]|uniref:hypothetical protein n=1 Tax=Fibrobacter sp. TaxID=35828 RepID=UPI00388F776E